VVEAVTQPGGFSLTGFFVQQSRQAGPPGLPTLREFQAAQGRTALAWLKIRTGWR